MEGEDESLLAQNILEEIGIAPGVQEIREQQNIYQAAELGKPIAIPSYSIDTVFKAQTRSICYLKQENMYLPSDKIVITETNLNNGL